MTGAWGPFVPGIDPAERKARLRSLRALVKVLTGPRGQPACLALIRAEIDPDMLEAAESEFRRLGTLDQRRVLSSYADVQSPNLKVVHG